MKEKTAVRGRGFLRLAFEHERHCLTCMEPLERYLKNDREYPTLVVQEGKIDCVLKAWLTPNKISAVLNADPQSCDGTEYPVRVLGRCNVTSLTIARAVN